jgi:hypothetical protein
MKVLPKEYRKVEIDGFMHVWSLLTTKKEMKRVSQKGITSN